MTATTLYRIASGVFVLFAAGHTFGFLSFKAPTAEALAVRAAMDTAVFEIGGSKFSFGGFYVGFGLSCTVSMLFYAVLAWQLGTLASSYPKAIAGIAWAFCAAQAVSTVLSFKYFGLPPMVLSVAVTALVGWAALLVNRA
jgi:hypothetical protein